MTIIMIIIILVYTVFTGQMVTGMWDKDRKLEDKMIFVMKHNTKIWETDMKLLEARLCENTALSLVIS